MKYGQIAESKKFNEAIYHCFKYIGDGEARKFVRKFKEQPHNKVQVMHTYRELLLGAYLSKSGLCVENERTISSKTPDWCVIDDGSRPQCIVELINFHSDVETSVDIIRQIRDKGIWCNFVKPNTERLYEAIWEKASKYRSIAIEHNIPYVVSLFCESTASVKQEEIDECLFDKEAGLFERYPEVSGLLFFEEASGGYAFIFKPNPYSSRSANIPSGWFEKHQDQA